MNDAGISEPSGGWLAGDGEPGLVSIAIPAYNNAGLIGETLASILAQTYDRIEVVVADDGSTDETPEVLARWRERFRAERGWELRVVRQENRGVCAARNAAARACRGQYLNFFDHDDLMPAGKVAAQERLLRATGAELVHGPFVRFYAGRGGYYVGRPRFFDCPDGDLLRAWLDRSGLAHWTCLLSRRFADRVGPWNEGLAGGREDAEYHVRCLALRPRMAHCPEAVVFQRRSLRSLSFTMPARAHAGAVAALELLEAHLRREGSLASHRRELAHRWREFAVDCYRDGAGELGDRCAEKAFGWEPEYRPPRRLLRKLAFRVGGLRLALRVEGRLERLRWLRLGLLARLGRTRPLEPAEWVRELPLGRGAAG